MQEGVSRNLYRVGDVKRAAIYAMTRGRGVEAVFWCMELVSSGFGGDAIYCMVLTWLSTLGSIRGEWYLRAWDTFKRDEVTAEQIAAYCVSLCSAIATGTGAGEEFYSSTRDSTAVLLLLERARGSVASEADSVRKGYLGVKEGDWNSLRAAISGRPRQLAFLDRLEQIDKVVGSESAERLLPLAFAVGYVSTLSMSLEQKRVAWRPLVLKKSREGAQWIEEDGERGVRRARRVYAIPSECLLRHGAAGGSTLEEIRHGLEAALFESELWGERIRCEYEGLSTDDARERFYDVEFPDDIPDEWSLADQEKSHGGGDRMVQWNKWFARHICLDRSAFLSSGIPSWTTVLEGLDGKKIVDVLGF
jgi:hypothetical protein